MLNSTWHEHVVLTLCVSDESKDQNRSIKKASVIESVADFFQEGF